VPISAVRAAMTASRCTKTRSLFGDPLGVQAIKHPHERERFISTALLVKALKKANGKAGKSSSHSSNPTYYYLR
jgi:hypothetical protein